MKKYLELLNIAAKGKVKLNVRQIEALLSPPDEVCEKKLFDEALKLKRKLFGNLVNLRGLIEFSNICICDCLYCGIRKSNSKVSRYTMSETEILHAAELASQFGYGAVVLQSGERRDDGFTAAVTSLIKKINALPHPPSKPKKLTDDGSKPVPNAIYCALKVPLRNFSAPSIRNPPRSRPAKPPCAASGVPDFRPEPE